MSLRFNSQDELTRRQFMLDNAKRYLGVSLSPLLGATLATPAFAQKTKNNRKPAKSVIYLYMLGGMSHIDTFDLKQKKKDIQGPVKGIKSAIGGYELSEYLPLTAKVLNKATVINSMTSTQGAHDQGIYLAHKSYSPLGTISHPSLGSWITRLAGRENKDLPGYVAIDSPARYSSGGWMGANYSAAMVGDPKEGLKNVERANSVSENDFDRRLALTDKLNERFHKNYASPEAKGFKGVFDEAVRVMKSKDLDAFDLSQEDSAIHSLYGNSNFGQGCLLARRLVEVGVRFVQVTLGGWDTHFDNFTAVEARCKTLDKAYSALLTDLDRKGLLESTLVVLTTEFGRTPEIDKSYNYGRSHHPGAFSSVLAGGGVKEGYVYGESDAIGRKVKDKPVTFFDLNSTIAEAVGVNHNEVLYSPSKRPFKVSGPDKQKGTPVMDLFS